MSTGFSSNIKSLVSMKDLTMANYNSHDCHVMMIVFVPIVIGAIGLEYVNMVITQMSYFLNRITQKVIVDEIWSAVYLGVCLR